ncbi:MAG: TetR family transcriptional regulator, partial [Streptomyces sp.]|nr:TetR family transcriptional regulator [Streptomyces sp.]
MNGTPPAPGPTAPSSRTRARRSEATRDAILVAARERFAADGYERATIRAIAKDAN